MLYRTALFVAMVISTLICTGCLRPSARFTQATCAPEYDGKSLTALRFTTDFETRNLANEQVLYEVMMLDSARRPIPTITGRFSDRQGNMTAGKAVMVLRPYWEFKGISVSLPAKELEDNGITDLAWAEFRVRDARSGAVLAQELAPVREPSLAKAPRREPSRATRSARPNTPSARATRPPPPGDEAPPARAGERAVARSGRPSVRPDGEDQRALSRPSEEPRAPSGRAGETQSTTSETPTGAARAPRTARSAPETADRSPGRDATRRVADRARPAASQPIERKHPLPNTPKSDPAVAAPTASASAPATAPSQSDEGEYYVVVEGDTLISIARQKLGDPWRWREIYALNRSQLGWPDELRAGMRLKLPIR